MTDLRKAAEMALEALECALSDDKPYIVKSKEAITALRQALVDADDTSQERVDEIVKDEHEPVAWANSFDLQNFDMKVRTGPDLHHTVPLYTAPPQRTWVGLTDEDIHDAFNFTEVVKQLSWDREPVRWCENFSAYIEAKLKERNHG